MSGYRVQMKIAQLYIRLIYTLLFGYDASGSAEAEFRNGYVDRFCCNGQTHATSM